MKKTITLIVLILSGLLVKATTIDTTEYAISFAAKNGETIDSVRATAAGKSVVVPSGKTLKLIIIMEDSLSSIQSTVTEHAALKIFPNPFKNKTNVQFYNPTNGMVTVQIYNLQGQTVASMRGELIAGNSQFTISGLGYGTYLVNVQTTNRAYTAKMVSFAHQTTSSHPISVTLTESNIPNQIGFDNSGITPSSASTKSATLRTDNEVVEMEYKESDELSLTAYADGYKDAQVTLIATKDTTITFSFVEKRPVTLLSPINGETIYTPHPRFRWQRLFDNIEDAYQIQIYCEDTIVVDDTLEVVSRYISTTIFEPNIYKWRVRKEGSLWSEFARFKIDESKIYKVANGASQAEITAIIQEAIANSPSPSKIQFEKGEYTISEIAVLKNIHNLTIDGGGSTFKTGVQHWLEYSYCSNVTLMNLNVEPLYAPNTHVEAIKKDYVQKTVTIKPKAGFSPNVEDFWQDGGNCAMRFVDPVDIGKIIRGASMSPVSLKLSGPDSEGCYTLSNVSNTALDAIKEGMTAYILKYNYGVVELNFTDDFTMSHVDLYGTSRAAMYAHDASAISFLSCRFLPLNENHHVGAQGFIGFGYTGMWIEDCDFFCAPDDNMAVQTRIISLINKFEHDSVLVLNNDGRLHEVRPRDNVFIWDEESNKSAVVEVLEVWDENDEPMILGNFTDRRPKKLVLAKGREELAMQMGMSTDATLQGFLVFRHSPKNNKDFVFRNNSSIGGSAGTMYNGMRGLIEDNYFKNGRGPGIKPGYHSPNGESGYGSRDVVVKNNIMENCGAFGIEIKSTAQVGGNIIIKNNTIKYTDLDNGLFWATIYIKDNIDNIVIKDNTFESTILPEWGAWIGYGGSLNEISESGNMVVSDFSLPMMKKR